MQVKVVHILMVMVRAGVSLSDAGYRSRGHVTAPDPEQLVLSERRGWNSDHHASYKSASDGFTFEHVRRKIYALLSS